MVLACPLAACHCACGVMAGATKASISRHFAVQGNFEELVSKEGSQEQFVNVLGLLLGYYVLKVLNESTKTVLMAFVLLTLLHVLANIMAVRQLRLRTVNEPRFRVLMDRFLRNLPLDVAAVGDAEPLLVAGRRRLGCSLNDVAHVPAAAAVAALVAAEGGPSYLGEAPAPGATALDALEALRPRGRAGGALARLPRGARGGGLGHGDAAARRRGVPRPVAGPVVTLAPFGAKAAPSRGKAPGRASTP